MASCLHTEVTIDSMMFFSFLPFLKGPLISAATVLRRGGAKFASYLELKNTCIIINVKQAKTNNNNKTKTNKTEKRKEKNRKKLREQDAKNTPSSDTQRWLYTGGYSLGSLAKTEEANRTVTARGQQRRVCVQLMGAEEGGEEHMDVQLVRRAVH